MAWDFGRRVGASLMSAYEFEEGVALKTEITLVDVGARGDLLDPWKSPSPPVKVIGFEADPIEHNRLGRKFPCRTYHPFRLGDPAQQGQHAEFFSDTRESPFISLPAERGDCRL